MTRRASKTLENGVPLTALHRGLRAETVPERAPGANLLPCQRNSLNRRSIPDVTVEDDRGRAARKPSRLHLDPGVSHRTEKDGRPEGTEAQGRPIRALHRQRSRAGQRDLPGAARYSVLDGSGVDLERQRSRLGVIEDRSGVGEERSICGHEHPDPRTVVYGAELRAAARRHRDAV